MDAVIQILGSLFILVPFVLVQLNRMDSKHWTYQALNLIGSVVLAVEAAIGQQWGFLLLEGVWAVVSFLGLIRPRARAKGPGH